MIVNYKRLIVVQVAGSGAANTVHISIGEVRNHKRDSWVALSKGSLKYKSSIFRKIAFQSKSSRRASKETY